MKTELSRQMVHLSGLLFVILAQFVNKIMISVYLFLIAITFLLYSICILREEKKIIRLFEKLESRLKEFAMGFERSHVKRPFIGAFWFFLACGLTFLIFPLNIASAAVTILAVGDSLSTLIGVKFGKHRIIGKKTIEGSIACFIGSMTSMIFIPFISAFFASILATILELVPDMKIMKKLKEKEVLDDNLLIPLISGLLIYVMIVVLGFM